MGRYSSGGALRHQRKPHNRPDFLRAHAVPSGPAVRSPVREGRGGTRARLPAWCVRLLRATPTMRMAPSRSNSPYPAPITASKREEKAVTSGRSHGTPSWPAKFLFGPRLRRQDLRLRRTAARLWGLTAQRDQTKRHSCLDWVSAP
jgi:hypothetical protein